MLTPKQAIALEKHAAKETGDPRLDAMNAAVTKDLVRKKLG